MKFSGTLGISLLVVTLAAATSSPARAAEPRVEVGASLASATVGFGDKDSSFAVPSDQVGVFTSLFLGSHFAVEPQIVIRWVRYDGGGSYRSLGVAAQTDYFFSGTSGRSAYIFGRAGLTDTSIDSTFKDFGGGVGYRIPVGDRLAFRIDTRVTHRRGTIMLFDFLGDESWSSNELALTVSVGGLFGMR